jgi:hypothetical protein
MDKTCDHWCQLMYQSVLSLALANASPSLLSGQGDRYLDCTGAPYISGSQPFMLHVPPGNVHVTGVPLVQIDKTIVIV